MKQTSRMIAALLSGLMIAECGMSASPIVVDDRVIVHIGGSEAAVSAYDAATGTKVWSAGSGAAAYSSPTLLLIDGTRQLVCFVGAGVLAIDQVYR